MKESAPRFSVSSGGPRRGRWRDALEAAGAAAAEDGRVVHARLRRGRSQEAAPALGRYRVQRLLGRGGWGAVWLAFDPRLQRRVAVKILQLAALDRSTRARQRLVREARAAAAISDPHVVQIFDVGETATGEVFIAMEYIEGGDLGQWLHAAPREPEQIIDRFMQAGRGLAAAHEAGVVHRDFKPSNVFLDANATAKVGDFGLAASVGVATRERGSAGGDAVDDLRLTRTGASVGTPRYMSPEQHNGDPIGPASDVYSFCLSLLEALASTDPVEGLELEGLRLAKSSGALRHKRDASVPEHAMSVIRRGLAPAPADRWPNMDALLAALEPRRRWRPIAAALIGLVVIAGVGLFSARSSGSATAAASIENPTAEVTSASPAARRLAGALDEVAALQHAGSYDAALALARELEVEARAAGQHTPLAAVLTEIGRLRLRTGNDAEARETLIEAFALAQQAADDETALAAATMLVEAAARAGGTGPDADDWVGHAEAAATRLGSPSEPTAQLAAALGLLAHARGQPEEACAQLQRSVGLYEAAGHGRDIVGVVAMQSLAVAQYAAGDYAAAAAVHARSLALLRPLTGREHPVYAAALDNAGAVHSALGDHGRAASMHAEALEILRGLPDPDPITVAIAFNNLAAAQRRLGDVDAARDSYQRGLDLLARALGGDHAELVGPLNNLGALERAEGAFGVAASRHARALAIAEDRLGPAHPSTIAAVVGLGYARLGLGRAAGALALFGDAIERCDGGGAELSCARGLFGRARAGYAQGPRGSAVVDATRARAVIEALAGDHEPDLRAIDSWLAEHKQEHE